jgi:3-methyladenine DNA glycosylase AlkC
MEPLKEMFNKKFYERLAAEFEKAHRSFAAEKFVKDVTTDLDLRSLNQRMRNTSIVLNKHLPSSYKRSLDVLQQVIPNLNSGYTSLLFPDYVSLFGHEDFAESMEALKFFTSFGSSEFAIREFLKRDFRKTIKVMYTWSEDQNHHVRRLSSEGSRPRLPWSFKLDEVIQNPKVTQPILENLKSDDELYVRKSVANHLNDISKDDPDYMLDLVKSWGTADTHTTWIVKRACRTLIKKGDKRSLAIFAFDKKPKIKINNFKLNQTTIPLDDRLEFGFEIQSLKSISQKILIDYCIHYKKKGGGLSPKVFKLKEFDLAPKQKITILKTQRMQDFTTRKHYGGIHRLELLVNGNIVEQKTFKLVV